MRTSTRFNTLAISYLVRTQLLLVNRKCFFLNTKRLKRAYVTAIQNHKVQGFNETLLNNKVNQTQKLWL